jgi:hypothetical protein
MNYELKFVPFGPKYVEQLECLFKVILQSVCLKETLQVALSGRHAGPGMYALGTFRVRL